MATPKFNKKSPTIKRILREAQELSTAPSADYTAAPLDDDLFEWHFTLRGPPHSCYAGGVYHGRITLPAAYPLRPPSFRFVTPSGRFEANREICLSISGHHEETWQPAWGVRTALVALRSFMETDPKGQLGGMEASDAVRRRMAQESAAFRCATCGRSNAEIMDECEAAAKAHAEEEGAASPAKEVEVPAELRMGFRDEMEKAAAAAAAAAGATSGTAAGSSAAAAGGVMDAESAELAEGFVQTAPLQQQQQAAVVATGIDTGSLPARPGQTVPQPTRTVPLQHDQRAAAAWPQQQQQYPPLQQPADQLSTVWVDRLIAVLSLALAFMLYRVLVGN